MSSTIRKRKNYPYTKYLNVFDSIYNEEKTYSLEEATHKLRDISSYFNKYKLSDLKNLKSELSGIIDEIKQTTLLSTFLSITITLILLILNIFKESIINLIPKDSTNSGVSMGGANLGLSSIVNVFLVLMILYVLVRIGISFIGFFDRYRKLSIFQKLLEVHISYRSEIDKEHEVALKNT
jgi:hypothetical protein